MSMTTGTPPSVNELQSQTMLTAQLKEATRLEDWVAFKNFFIKLLNQLIGMTLEDKEKYLYSIYNFIYGKKIHSIETLWPAVEGLIYLIEGDHVRNMEFELVSHNSSSKMGLFNTPDHLILVIRVNGHALPRIALSNSDMHHEMLSNVISHNMVNKIDADGNGAPGIYQLNPTKLISQGNSVKLDPSAVMATIHGFEVAKVLEASRELVQMPIKDISSLDDQIMQLEHYKNLIDYLKQLRSTQNVCTELHSKFIDNALTALDTHRLRQQENYKHLNHGFVGALIEICANGLVEKDLLNKESITTKLSLLSTLTPHIDALFNQVDGYCLQRIQSQLRLAYQVANLQEQLQSSETFPDDLAQILINLKTQLQALPNGKPKEFLLHNIATLKIKLLGINCGLVPNFRCG